MIKVKILGVEHSKISFILHDERTLRSDEPFWIKVKTNVGTFHYHVDDGLITDGRSGGRFVDFILPHYGSGKYSYSWLIHDLNFICKRLSFQLSNSIFYHMLRWSGVGFIRSRLAYLAVSSPFGLSAYYHVDDDAQKKIKFEWIDR